MKSRLAVSLLFILIGSTFTSDATAAFEKLGSWINKVSSRSAAQVCNCLTPHSSARLSAIKCSGKEGATQLVSSQAGQIQGVRLMGSEYHSQALEFITTATRQVREVLNLMSIK